MRSFTRSAGPLALLLGGFLIVAEPASSQVVVALGVRVTSVAGSTTVTWLPLKGAIAYTVDRWKLDQPDCCRNTSGRQSGGSWTDAPLPQAGTYVYRVTVRFPDGRYGYNDQQFSSPAAAGGATGGAGAKGGVATGAGAADPKAAEAVGGAAGAGAGAGAAGAVAGAAGGAGAKGGVATGAGAADPRAAEAAGGAAGASGAVAGAAGAAAGAAGGAGAKGGVATGGGAVDPRATQAAGGAAGAAGAVAGAAGGAGAKGGVATGGGAAKDGSELVNPSRFTAAQTGAGEVRLTWQPVSGASAYRLLGPGLPRGGVKVTGSTTYTVSKIPSGVQRWHVGSLSDAGASTPTTAFTPVELTVGVPH